jgi:hypothetical protein
MIRVPRVGHYVLDGVGHPMTALPRIEYRTSGRWRRSALSPFLHGACRVVTLFGMLAAATAAKADDWQLCIDNLPDQVLAPCTAVIAHGGREPVELARASQ